jgi:hypothetical protein
MRSNVCYINQNYNKIVRNLSFNCVLNNKLLINDSKTKLNIKELSNNINEKSKRNEEMVKNHLFSIGLELSEIENMFKNYPKLKTQPINDLKKVCKALDRKHLCSPSIITKSCWNLFIPELLIRSRIKTFEKYHFIKHIINGKTFILILFLFPQKQFIFYSKKLIKSDFTLFQDFYKRLDYFCRELQITEEEFCSIIGEHLPLLTMNFERIEYIMQLAKEAGIQSEDIFRDIWIFRHNIDLMKKRLQECKQFEYPVKVWVLRSPDKIWYKSLNHWKEEIGLIGKDCDKIGFLANKLMCNKKKIEQMVERYPRILTVRSKKIFDIISFLYDCGYSSNEIISHPRVMAYSLDRIQNRINLINELNKSKVPLNYISTQTDKQFESYIKCLKDNSV